LLSSVICELLNLSIRERIFPSCLKIGRVISIFKSGKKDQKKNYRPITTLPVLAKPFEKLAHKRMMKISNKFEKINGNQFGFIANHNASDALLEFLIIAHDAVNNNDVLLAILLEYSKAFDTVDNQILLEFYGIRGTSLQLIRSLLMNGKQFVDINSERSSTCVINIGVPQGSTSGPLLFILYMNDFRNSLTHLKSIHFADDTTLYKQLNPSVDHAVLINAELANVQEWISVNKLSLNVQKNNYMVISSRTRSDNLKIILSEQSIERICSHKFLGVRIDGTLKLDAHINQVCVRISQSIGIMRRISNMVPLSVLRNLYYALLFSRLAHAICTVHEDQRIQLTCGVSNMKKAIMLVTNYTNQDHILITVGRSFLQYDDVYRYFIPSKTYDIIREGKHKYLSDKFNRLLVPHRYEARFNLERRFNTPSYVKS